MTVLQFLFAWANAPFSVAAGIAVVFAILQASGVMGLLAGGDHDADGDADADVDADGDVDADADADVDADAEADADGDHEAETDQDHEADGSRGFGFSFLGALGVGKVPFSILWQSYAFAFAITGLSLNAHLAETGAIPLHTLAWTLPISLLTGYGAVSILSRVLAPIFATKGQEATSRKELVGQLGVVISSSVTKDFGEVRIKDKTGHEVRVVCRLAPGSTAPTERENIVVVDYDEEQGLLVAPLDDEKEERRAAP